MTGWIVLGCVLLVLFLISLIRLGGRAEYSADGFYAWIKLGTSISGCFHRRRKRPEKSPGKRESPPKSPQARRRGEGWPS